jgi:hypothetical protein
MSAFGGKADIRGQRLCPLRIALTSAVTGYARAYLGPPCTPLPSKGIQWPSDQLVPCIKGFQGTTMRLARPKGFTGAPARPRAARHGLP